jgi:hypothetical protein
VIAARPDPDEYYRGHGVKWYLSRRTAKNNAGFFVHHLRPGMRLLDCGCGPATITVGLAESVAPGETVGIDLAPAQSGARPRACRRARAIQPPAPSSWRCAA